MLTVPTSGFLQDAAPMLGVPYSSPKEGWTMSEGGESEATVNFLNETNDVPIKDVVADRGRGPTINLGTSAQQAVH